MSDLHRPPMYLTLSPEEDARVGARVDQFAQAWKKWPARRPPEPAEYWDGGVGRSGVEFLGRLLETDMERRSTILGELPPFDQFVRPWVEVLNEERGLLDHLRGICERLEASALRAPFREAGPPSTPPGETDTKAEGRSGSKVSLFADRYRIMKVLGRGGTGIAYLAEDMSIKRPSVVIKVPRLLSPPAQDNFLREAEVAAQLDHPGIARVLHYERHEQGWPYLVLQFVEGHALARTLKDQTKLPWSETAKLIADVADILVCAHSKGCPHRDVTPANILLHPDGKPRLIDFHVGRGTPGYRSPEQDRGESGDERSDVFSLGVVLYQCLTGQLPSPAMGAAEPPPSEREPSVPPELDRLCLEALSDNRPTMAEMARRLREAVARPPESPARPQTCELKVRDVLGRWTGLQWLLREESGWAPITFIAAGLLAVTLACALHVANYGGGRIGFVEAWSVVFALLATVPVSHYVEKALYAIARAIRSLVTEGVVHPRAGAPPECVAKAFRSQAAWCNRPVTCLVALAGCLGFTFSDVFLWLPAGPESWASDPSPQATAFKTCFALLYGFEFYVLVTFLTRLLAFQSFLVRLARKREGEEFEVDQEALANRQKIAQFLKGSSQVGNAAFLVAAMVLVITLLHSLQCATGRPTPGNLAGVLCATVVFGAITLWPFLQLGNERDWFPERTFLVKECLRQEWLRIVILLVLAAVTILILLR